MANPKVTAELIDGRFQIQVENWIGIPAMAFEYLTFDLYKAMQLERLKIERESKKQEQQAADVVVTDGNKEVKNPIDDQFLKELENATLK